MSGTRPSHAGGCGERPGPGPGSLSWSLVGDARGLLLAPATIVLQLAHPTVGAGMAQHSDFTRHPWGRLLRTINSSIRSTYGSERVAAGEAARLREMHAGITGVDDRGRRYAALDPAASAWVHLTLSRYFIDVQSLLGRRLPDSDAARFYREWRTVGLGLGVPDAAMPADWGAFGRYFDTVVSDVLEDNQAVRHALALTRRPPPPARWLAGPLWDRLTDRPAALHELFTVGALPGQLRERLGLAWSEAEERKLQRWATGIRRAGEALPAPLHYYPQVAPHVLAAALYGRRPGGPLRRRPPVARCAGGA